MPEPGCALLRPARSWQEGDRPTARVLAISKGVGPVHNKLHADDVFAKSYQRCSALLGRRANCAWPGTPPRNPGAGVRTISASSRGIFLHDERLVFAEDLGIGRPRPGSHGPRARWRNITALRSIRVRVAASANGFTRLGEICSSSLGSDSFIRIVGCMHRKSRTATGNQSEGILARAQNSTSDCERTTASWILWPKRPLYQPTFG